MRQLARAADRLRRAAAQIAVVVRIRPQLERHADRLGSALRGEHRCDGAVDSAAHRDERALGTPGERGALAHGTSQSAMQRISRQLGCVALGGAEPAQLLCYLLRADPRGCQQRASAQQANGRAASCNARPAAARVEAGILDAPLRAMRVDGERDANQIAARRPAGGTGEGVRWRMPPPERPFEVVDQLLASAPHSSECTARTVALRRSPVRSSRRR